MLSLSEDVFVRGAFRVLVTDDALGDLIEQLADILVLDEGPQQYGCRPGIYDFATSRSGAQIQVDGPIVYVSTQLAEVSYAALDGKFADVVGDGCTLIFLTQRPTGEIMGWVLPDARRIRAPEDSNFQWRGEATAIPVRWHCNAIRSRIMTIMQRS